ncbi:hypothetical protein [Chryseobacterium endalhagicum]|uniref:hypothetical protein n=1 Tax=Chryseobacterium endalhagicum TaxID=2797638 RepID=UPI001E436BB5|nr:hypothetical protein [Chryseobacterium endalhagicum]
MNHDGYSFPFFFLRFDVFKDQIFLMQNLSFMLNILFFDDPADKRPVGKENKRNDNCYGNNYQDKQANI